MDELKAAVEESYDSEESDYRDFATPQQQDQDNGSYDLEWDQHEETPSFQFEEAASFLGDDQGDGSPDGGGHPAAQSSPVFGGLPPPPPRTPRLRPFVFNSDPDAPLAAWPPRNLSSEFIQGFLVSKAVPAPAALEEDLVDEVFLEEGNREEDADLINYPDPILPQLEFTVNEDSEDEVDVEQLLNIPTEMALRTPEEIALQAFKRAKRNWSQNAELFKAQADILPAVIEDMKKKKADAEDLADSVFDLHPDEDSNEYKQTLEDINKIRRDLSALYEIQHKAELEREAANSPQQRPPVPEAAAPVVEDPDVGVGRSVMKLLNLREPQQADDSTCSCIWKTDP